MQSRVCMKIIYCTKKAWFSYPNFINLPMVLRLSIFLLFLVQQVAAQNFGGFPPSTNWRQLNSDTARVIYTGPAQWQAQRVATLIHRMAADTPFSIGRRLKKINVVLHGNTTQANGYVALGPFRSEFYLIPGSNIFDFGNLPWHENLAIHEYRHAQQYNNFNHGVSKAFGWVLGQQGQALANALSIPDWFFEGDAVFAETALTGLGRGRQPLFLSAYNSLWQEGTRYSWQKLRNGSLKDFVPNHYHLGYLLVNYGYLQYGNGFWQKVTRDASAFKGFFYPFQRAVRKYSGKEFKTFRNEALDYYRNQVRATPDKQRPPATVTNYFFPRFIGKDSLLYLRESYRELPAFYIRTKDKEHRIKLRSISSEDWFSYRNGVIAYTAFSIDKRWSLTDYSDIVLLRLSDGTETQLTNKGKFYTPDIAPDGKSIITVSVTDSLFTELHWISSSDASLIRRFRAPDRAFLLHPRFVNAEEIILGLRSQEGMVQWNRMNLHTGAMEPLLGPSLSAAGYPHVQDSMLYLTASFKGNDDLYAVHLTNKKVSRLTADQTGNYYVSSFEDSLVFASFTASGLQLRKLALASATNEPLSLPKGIAQQAMFAIAGDTTNILYSRTRTFSPARYRKSAGLFQFHSWDPSSAAIYSNNILNTMEAEIFYRYNEAENSHATGFNLAYGGWYPVINAGYEYIFNRHIETPARTHTANSWEARLGYHIPWNFTKGKTLKAMRFGTDFVYNRFEPTGASKNLLRQNDNRYLNHFLSWAQQRQRARQHIYPRLGYAVSGSYRHLLNKKGFQGNAGASVSLPSFGTNHSIVLTASFQGVDTGNTVFSNRFSLARGYRDFYFTRMWTAGFNYHMPLLYPDLGLASIVYLLRLRSNLYFDYSKVYSKTRSVVDPLRSTGVEIFFDTRWWNQLPVSFGVRYSYLLDSRYAEGNRNRFEFIVPVGLIPD